MNHIDLQTLCSTVRDLCDAQETEECRSLICRAMGKYPDAAQPHNLLGIVLAMEGDPLGAMKHFRAAWALDPAYQPANQNLNTLGTFRSAGLFAFDESDVIPEFRIPEASAEKKGRQKFTRTEIEYDADGIGHVIRRREH